MKGSRDQTNNGRSTISVLFMFVESGGLSKRNESSKDIVCMFINTCKTSQKRLMKIQVPNLLCRELNAFEFNNMHIREAY